MESTAYRKLLIARINWHVEELRKLHFAFIAFDDAQLDSALLEDLQLNLSKLRNLLNAY